MAGMITAENLYYAFQEEDWVLNGINLEIKTGEFLALIGPNGSGKSTLARHFNGLLLPSRGTVLVEGMSTLESENIIPIRRQVGMVFQHPDNQIVAATVEEDVAFGPENLGVPSGEIRDRVEEALSCVGLLSVRKHEPHLLSGGQKQRLAIAGVLAMRPKCIIMDEPTAMLDPQGRKEVIASVEDLHRQGYTIIYVTHFMEEAARAARVVVLKNGRIVLEGSPRDVFVRVSQLESMGLEAPTASTLAFYLREGGVSVGNIIEAEELVQQLWKLRLEI